MASIVTCTGAVCGLVVTAALLHSMVMILDYLLHSYWSEHFYVGQQWNQWDTDCALFSLVWFSICLVRLLVCSNGLP